MYCTLNWTLFCFCATCQSVTSRSREFPVPGILLLFGSYRYRYRKKLVPEKSTGTGKKSGYCHTLPPGQRTVICYNVMCFTGGARVRSVTAELPSCQTALSPRFSVNLVVRVMVHRWSASDGGDDNDEHSRSTVNPDKDW